MIPSGAMLSQLGGCYEIPVDASRPATHIRGWWNPIQHVDQCDYCSVWMLCRSHIKLEGFGSDDLPPIPVPARG